MFSPQIVESDAFLDMALSTQALYFHLGMKADDDGFVNPRSTMRSIGASDDELKVLIGKRFVLPFDNGVVVVKHWKINNQIKPDRYHPTIYEEQRALLGIKSNGAYTERFQNGSRLEPESRLGKVRLGNNTQASEDAFSKFWEEYPKKKNKGDAIRAWKKLRVTPEFSDTILAAVRAQKKQKDWVKENGRYIPYPASWLNAQGWLDEIDTTPVKSNVIKI